MSALQWILLGLGGLLVLGGLGMGGGLVYLSRNQPADAAVPHGVEAGKLSPCPETPNCVSSQAPEDDRRHYVDPIRYRGSLGEARAAIGDWLEAQENGRLVEEDGGYIRVVFHSRIFGFQDDLEILLRQEDTAGDGADGGVTVHVRSAARVGQGDMGVNRRRYESLREALTGNHLSES